MPTPREQFSSSLHHSARAWRLALDRRLKHLGLGQPGWMTIALAAKAQQPLSQTDLAHALGVEGATVVVMIDRLVKAKLVKRQPSTSDRRIKHVMLTDQGLVLHGQVKAVADAFRREMLADEDEELLLKATELLERVRIAAENTK